MIDVENRQLQPYPRAGPGAVKDVDAAAMQPGDLTGEIETEAGTTRTRAQTVERFEDALPFVVGNAGTVIMNLDAAPRVDQHGYGSAVATMLDGIAQEVGNGLFNLLHMNADRHRFRRIRLEGQFVAGFESKRREIGGKRFGQGNEVNDLAAAGAVLEHLAFQKLLRQMR